MAKPVPPHFGQVTNPLRWLWSQTLHFPTTTHDSLRASPVPLHAGHATSCFPPQRGHSAFSSPTGIPPFSPNRSPTEIRSAQSAVSEDRLYVILAMCTTPAVTRTFKSAATSVDPYRMAFLSCQWPPRLVSRHEFGRIRRCPEAIEYGYPH